MLSSAFACTLWIALHTAVVSGDYIFVLRLISFDNPSNSVAGGDCCQMEDTCTSQCNIYLRFCLRPAGLSHSNFTCPYLDLHGDARPRTGNWAVRGPWLGSIQLYIRATHTIGEPDQQAELTDDLLIDQLYTEIENLTAFSPLTPAVVYTGEGGLVVSELQFQVVCTGNWYGPYCDIECHGRDDSGGHYRCNREGEIECLEGYQNEETNCTECVAAEGCTNGYCDAPLNCVCEDGWNGTLCTDCVPSQNCSLTGGYCQSPGECLCRDGYSGDNCELAPTSTVIHQARSPVMITASTPTPDLASSEASTYIVTPSLNGVDEATSHISKKTEMIVLPTVGGVAPGAKSTNRWSVSMTLTMVAGAGGLLLLLMMLLCIIALLVATKRRHRKRYVMATSGLTQVYDENRLLESTTPVSSEIEDVTFTTFRNGNTHPQEPLRRELHVYYHRNTPEPPSSRTGDREGEEEEEEEEVRAAESVELEFPSGYTDPWPIEENESYLQWSSLRSDKGEHLVGEESGAGASNGLLRATLNEYQFN